MTIENTLLVGEALDSFNSGTPTTVQIRGVVCSDNQHCWMPRTEYIERRTERSQSILIREPGFRERVGFGRRNDGLIKSYEFEIKGILSRSYITPFPVILGPILELRYLEGDFTKPLNVDRFSRVYEEELLGLLEMELDAGDLEREFLNFYGKFQQW